MYFLSLFYLEKSKKDFKNVNLVGFWNTKEEAEAVLRNEWEKIHEHWCNSAVIEYHRPGFIGLDRASRDFYHTEDISKAPEKCEMPPIFKNIGNLLG